MPSLSARRAWIEICQALSSGPDTSLVALRKESVDRNIYVVGGRATGKTSLSARRAWIEILNTSCFDVKRSYVALRKESVDRNSKTLGKIILRVVALRKESVDRNQIAATLILFCACRSPQGERG